MPPPTPAIRSSGPASSRSPSSPTLASSSTASSPTAGANSRPESSDDGVSAGLDAHREQVEALRAVGREFHQRGWSLGTSSNYSVVLQSEPLRLLVTASGKDKGCLGPHDFVCVGADGVPTFQPQPKSSAETLLHCVLATLPGCGAVLHTHSVWGTLLSDWHFPSGALRLEGYEMLKGLEGITTHQTEIDIKVFDNTQDIPQLAEEVREWLLGDRLHPPHAFLIRRHGLYTWGQDLSAARRHIEILEFLFECSARDRMARPGGNAPQ